MIYLFKNAWKYAGKDKWKIIVFFVLHTLSFCGVLLQPFAFGKAISTLQQSGINDLEATIKWLALYLIGFLMFQIFHHTARWFEMTVAYTSQKNFIDDMYKKVYDLPMKWHTDHHSGEIVNRINTASTALRNYGFCQNQYLGNILLSIGPILILISFSWKYAAICIVLTGLNLVIVQKMNTMIQPILHKINDATHSYTAKLFDFVGNIRTVINLRLKNETSAVLDSKFDIYLKEHMREFRINQPRCFISASGAFVTEIIIILFFLWSAKESGSVIVVGSLVAIVSYFKQMSESFFDITSTFYDTLEWKTALQSVQPILDATEQFVQPATSEYKHAWDRLSIRHLNFSYNNNVNTLSDITFNVRSNSKTAIIGLSGSGKSTLLSVLAGLYAPKEVQLNFDNHEFTNLSALSELSILAPQDVEIFENTLRYNITFGMDATSEELEKVLCESRFNEVLKKFPLGFDTDIREKGVNLSGGEKQRLALARALFFAKHKKLLLLDEVTSNIDAFNERLIYQNIFEHYQSHTIITTVHRLHLTEMFDQIIVMDQGKIVEVGTFNELIALNGHFKNLWNMHLIEDPVEEELII